MVTRCFIAAALLFSAACRTDLFFGKAEGIAADVLASNGRTPIYHARVTIEDLEPYGYYAETYTTAAGNFSFPAVPDAQYRVAATSANGLFETTFHIEVEDGYSAGDVETLMAPARTGTFVCIPGRYDDMGEIFSDLGYVYRSVGIEELAGPTDPLAGAELVCLHSGVEASWAQNENVVARLRSFVAGGGHVLISDRAWPFLKAAWPSKVTWAADPAIGTGGQEIEAELTDTDLKKCATVSKWRLRYDLGNWALPEGTVGSVFARGTVGTSAGSREGAPLLLGFADGSGYVTYSTFGWRTQYDYGRLPVRVFNYLIANK